jgi:Zn finger protein HypA/HybF involved in hydrogenase expression
MTDIDRACEIVYERITGKCWHGVPILDDERAPTKAQCPKCEDSMSYAVKDLNNPPLSFSLDAWRPIWEAMTEDQRWKHIQSLDVVVGKWTRAHGFMYAPLHHLEAALRMLGEDEIAEKVREGDNG